MITRRRILELLAASGVAPALSGASSAFAQTQALGQYEQRFFRRRSKPDKPDTMFVYIGVDTAPGIGKGIYVCTFDRVTGHLTDPVLAAETMRPAFLAVRPARDGKQYLYATNEGNDTTSSITSFLIDPASGGLHQIGKVSSGFGGPCYLSVDATGESAYVADYGGGGIASYRILLDGSLSEPIDRVDFRSPQFGPNGPNRARQDAPHPHSATISPDNRFLVVNDLGKDAISVFAIDPQTARLGPPQTFTNHRAGSGPRHVAFHPNGQWVYGICELDSKIDQYLWNQTHGPIPTAYMTYTGNTVSSVAENFHPTKQSGDNTGSEIVVSPSGHFVYASNRGENSLAMFAIDQATGALTFKQRIPCGGKTPRQFTLDPTGRWILCGNQNSATVTVFSRNDGDGHITGPVQTLNIDSPLMILCV